METLWKLAKSIELEGEKMYEEFALNANKKEISGAFSALAKEENRHYEIFDKLERASPMASFVVKSESVDISGMFDMIRSDFHTNESVMEDTETTYRKALIAEKKSIELYNKILSELTDEHQMKALKIILHEEERHVRIIEELIDYVRRPKEWLENAEVYHLVEY